MTGVRSWLAEPRLRRALRFAIVAAVILLGLSISPLGTTSVQVTMTSSSAGTSTMLFAKTLQDFSPLRSSVQPLRVGENLLDFSFSPANRTLGFHQRWDLCACAGTFTVKDLAMRSPLLSWAIPLERLQPGPGINSLTTTSDGVQITTEAATKNPQVVTSARLGAFYALNLAILAGLAIVMAALLTYLGLLLRNYLTTTDGWPALAWQRISAAFRCARQEEAHLVTGRPPLLLSNTITVVAGVVLLANIAMMFAGAMTVGIWWDEPTHVLRLQQWLVSGWYIPAGLLVDGQSSLGDAYVYAPVAALLGHAAAVLLGAEGLTSVESSPIAYAARHVSVGLVAVLGLAAVATIARILFGSWRWGVLGAALLSAMPLWTGHAMFNIKDIPVATGWTLVTLGLVVAATPRFTTRASYAVAAATSLGVGIVLAVGTRPGVWPGLVVASAVMLILTAVLNARYIGWRPAALNSLLRFGVVAAASAAAYCILLVIYPRGFSNPWAIAVESVRASADYSVWIDAPASPSYFLTFAGLQTPVLILISTALGVGVSLALVGNALLRRGVRDRNLLAVTSAVLLCQLLLFPAAAILLGSTVYDGLRQFLFMLPAIALLALMGIYSAFAFVKSRPNMRLGRPILVGVASLAVVAPTVEQFGLFPYNYVYYSLAGTAARFPSSGTYFTDRHQVSLREIAERLPSDTPVYCGPSVAGATVLADGNLVGPPYIASNCASRGTVAPFLPGGRVIDQAVTATQTGFAYLFAWGNGRKGLPANCSISDPVLRKLRSTTLTLGWLARCEGVFAGYPTTGVVLSPDTGREFLLDGWALPAGGSGAWSVGDQGRVGVSLPEGLRDRELSISLLGYRLSPPGESRSLRVLVNDVQVANVEFQFPVGDATQRIEFAVPARIADRLGEGRILITLQTPEPVVPSQVDSDGETRPLGFLLKSLSIRAGGST